MPGLYMTHRHCPHGIMAYRYAMMSLRVHLPKQPTRSTRPAAHPRIGLKPDQAVAILPPGGRPEIIRENSGSSNGMTFDLQGRLLICEGDNRQVTRREADGTYTPLAQRLGVKCINRPNDIVTRSDGSVYFTDPGGRLSEAERELGFNGVHRIAPDGTLTNATAETEYPNGIAFSPDERILYVAITRRDEECSAEKA